jgi:hypothetical protein
MTGEISNRMRCPKIGLVAPSTALSRTRAMLPCPRSSEAGAVRLPRSSRRRLPLWSEKTDVLRSISNPMFAYPTDVSSRVIRLNG